MQNLINSITIALDQRSYALMIGLLLGLGSGFFALALVVLGPLETFVALIAVGLALLALSNLDAALMLLLATVALLPYGTLPFSIALTPSLIDTALGIFLVVYLFQWMTGRRIDLRTSWVHLLFMLLILVLLVAFLLGTANAPLTPGVLRRFVGLLGNIVLALVIFDVVRNHASVRRITAIVIVFGAFSGLIGTILWLLPDLTAESILNRLGRIGYPVGGVIRYREDGVSIGIERAIGTWIDPNAYGGFLMMVGALTAPQLLAKRSLFKYRWVAFVVFGMIGTGLFLSNSRGSMLGLIAGTGLVALLRYRRLIYFGIVGAILVPILPPTRDFLDRVISGFTGADLETQMRLGEYGDAIELIARYPLIGVGFGAPPDIDLYLGFASTYLTIASNAGLVGLAAYLLTLLGIFAYGGARRQALISDDSVNDVWFGYLAGIFGALVSGIFDHFYFNIEFQATSLLFWFYVGMFLAIARNAQAPATQQTSWGFNVPSLAVFQLRERQRNNIGTASHLAAHNADASFADSAEVLDLS